jgi:sugar lactone lactonase YvrE
MAIDGAGNIYIADANGARIRMVNASTGLISTVAGNGNPGYSGDGGQATGAQLANPTGVAIDGAGNLYIADEFSNRIRMVNAFTHIITTVAGTGGACTSYATTACGDGGPATGAQFNNPTGVAFDQSGNLYIADSGNNLVRRVSPSGSITSVAGTGVAGNGGDGSPMGTQLNSPSGVAVDSNGNVYIADTSNNRILQLSLGNLNAVAGGGSGCGNSSSVGDGCIATAAVLNGPFGVVVDAGGNLYIADKNNNLIRKVDGDQSTRLIHTIAGGGSQNSASYKGAATSVQLNNPFGVTLDAAGNLYIADSYNNVVRKVLATQGQDTTPLLNFPQTNVGQNSATQPVTVSNTGNTVLHLSNMATSTNFSIDTTSGSTTCVNPGTVGPGDVCVIGVQLSPTSVGPLTGALTLTDDDKNANPLTTQQLQMSGSGAQQSQTINFPNPGTQTYGVSPLTLGATATSGLTVSYTVTAGSATVSGSTLTITGTGPVTVQATQAGNSAWLAATPVSVTFTVNAAVLTPPTADSATPNTSTSSSQTFSLAYSVRNGKDYTDLSRVYVQLSASTANANGCYVEYFPASNSLDLLNDAGSASLGPLTPGAAGTLSNSQCTVNGAGTTVNGSGPTLTLNLAVTGASGYLGTKNIYMWASDTEGLSSGWQNKGTWTPNGLDTAPTADSATPSTSTNNSQTFSLAYSVRNGKGYTDLSSVYVQLSASTANANGCYVEYFPASNSLYLLNDAGSASLGPLTPGAAGTLSNSQCTVNGAGTTASGSGPTLTLNLAVTGASGYLGTKNIYMWASDTEGTNSGWQNKGTWTPIGPDTPPTADSATPNTSTSNSQTFSLAYSIHNGKGYTDLSRVYVQLSASTANANGCYVEYFPASNSLYLLNDAGSASLGPLTPGAAGTLSNSQCTINGVGTTVNGSGPTLTLNLAVTGASGYLGTKNIYLWASDTEGLSSGWQNKGTWTPGH